MADHDQRLRQPRKKPELTDADKALLEAEPDWQRMGEGAKRLLNTKPDHRRDARSAQPEPRQSK